MNTITFIDDVLRDARHALRMSRRRPGFSVAALLSLALGIGGNTAVFSVLNAVLIRPLPYPESGALVGVANTFVIQGQVFKDAALSAGMYAACQERARVFENFGVWTSGSVTVTGMGDPEQLAAVTATQGVLPTLGVPAYFGRWFSKEDDTPGSPETVILSYGYWQRKFGGNREVLGRTMVIDLVPHQVIGVMPRDFRFVNLSTDIFVPRRFPKSGLRPDEFSYTGIARLKPGITVPLANQDVARVWHTWGETDTKIRKMLESFNARPNIHPLKADVVGDIGSVLTVLMGALGLVLLLVCTNVANLVLVRAQSRRQEFAIRAALGAGWGSIARALLVESLILGILGGALGSVLAYVGLRALVTQGPAGLPRLAEISLDQTALAFALACSVGSSMLFGLAAVLRCRIPGRIQSTRGATEGAEQLRAQNGLVITQVALAFVLLVASGLMIRTLLALQAVKPGFTHPEWIQTVRISIPEALAPDPERVIRMQHEISNRLSAIHGVTTAGFASGLPMDGDRNGIVIAVEGKTSPDQMPPNRAVRNISPGLLAAQGTRMVAGRDFTWEDAFGLRDVAIVSENMARENWGDPANSLGKRIRFGKNGPWNEVVGVAEDVHADGLNRPAPATVYSRVGGRRAVTFAIRGSRAGTDAFVREVADAIHAVNPNLPLAKVRTLNHVYRQSMARTSFALFLLGIAGAMALTLAIVGVYGALAYALAQRRREVGIRLALGAEPRAVKWLFIRKGLVVNCIGGIMGLALTVGLSRWISSLLFGVTPLDPLTYVAAEVLIAAAVMTASYVPARQAASVDPMDTLRSE